MDDVSLWPSRWLRSLVPATVRSELSFCHALPLFALRLEFAGREFGRDSVVRFGTPDGHRDGSQPRMYVSARTTMTDGCSEV